MNRKMFLVPLIMVLMVFAVAPVMAAPQEQKVSASILMTAAFPPVSTSEPWVTDGGIQQIRGENDVFLNVLDIGGQLFNVYSSNIADSSWNMKTGVKIVHYDATWYISSDGSPDGFKGNVEGKFYDWGILPNGHPTFSMMSVHCVMQGFGDFAGQTIKLSYEGSNSHDPWTGYCLEK